MTQVILDSLFRKQERDKGFADESNLRTLTLPWSTQKIVNCVTVVSWRPQIGFSHRCKTMEYRGVVGVAVVDNVAVKSLKKASKTILGFSVWAFLTFLDPKNALLWGCPVCCRVFAWHPGLYPLDGRGTLSPQVVVTSNMSRHDWTSLWVKCLQVEKHSPRN